MNRVFFSFYTFIIFSLFFVHFVLDPVINKVAQAYLQNTIVEYNREIARGAFHMMELDLMRLPQDQWKTRIKELGPQFGYQIDLLDYSSLHLAQEQLDQLREGKIAVVKEGDFLYHKVGNSEMILSKGPFSVLEPDNGVFIFILWIGISVVLGLLTLIWIIPYWRKLSKISTAATAFGNGNFNTRVDISKRSSLTSIASAFNTMADRIQQLISSHKELTNAVSHELRTPLSRLRFGLELLETADDLENRSHYAKELQTDVTELEELVSELLTFARFDRERPDLQFGMHPLEPFLRQLTAESVPGDSPVSCKVHCHLDDQSGQARFEPKYLERAITNLIQNALRHANRQIQIIVERNGRECTVHIDDDGPGIPAQDRQKVFEPFTRLDASRSRASGGYGLGLAIVIRIMKWHDGQATVADSPLGGARLTLSWPGFAK